MTAFHFFWLMTHGWLVWPEHHHGWVEWIAENLFAPMVSLTRGN